MLHLSFIGICKYKSLSSHHLGVLIYISVMQCSLSCGQHINRFNFSFLGIVGLNNIKANDYLNVVLQVKK